MAYITSKDPCEPGYLSPEEMEERNRLREEAELERADFCRENL